MRRHDYDVGGGRDLRLKSAWIDVEEPGLTYRAAAAAGRTDVLGPAGLLGLHRLVGNAGVVGLVEKKRSPMLDVVDSRGGSARAHADTIGSKIVFQRDKDEPASLVPKPILPTVHIQRYKVAPMPRISRQSFIWRPGTKLVDLNCGWYAQLAVVDYHYVNTIVPGGYGRPAAEKGATGHLSYAGGKNLLPYTPGVKNYGFSPDSEVVGAHPSAKAIEIDKPTSTAEWKLALQNHGPLIVSKAAHYVVVVGVTKRAFYYLDSLTGGAAYHDYRLMQFLIDGVYYVPLTEVKALFGMP
ncbi:MAG: hypothetical protein ACRDSP_25780 [Pseudonocardiaceae bacterium]